MSKEYLVDTQTLILAYISPDKLPRNARRVMEDPAADRILSTVSVVEIGIKSGLGKLLINANQLRMAIRDLKLRVIPFSVDHAFELFCLPQRTDMFDRMLVATALALNIPIVGGDQEFARYPRLRVIW